MNPATILKKCKAIQSFYSISRCLFLRWKVIYTTLNLPFVVFLQDLLFFIPREEKEILEDLKEMVALKQGLSLAEVSFFDRVCRLLRDDRGKSERTLERERDKIASARVLILGAEGPPEHGMLSFRIVPREDNETSEQ